MLLATYGEIDMDYIIHINGFFVAMAFDLASAIMAARAELVAGEDYAEIYTADGALVEQVFA